MAALVELLLLVGTLTTFRFEDAALLPVPFMGSTLLTTGYTTCSANGRPTITLARRAATIEATLLHELAHARDCLDNGVVDGSLLASGAILERSPAHCHGNRAEYYACWVTEQAIATAIGSSGATPSAAIGEAVAPAESQ